MASEAFNKGCSLFVDESYDQALEQFNLAIKQDSKNVEYFLKRSACHTKLKNYPDAIADCNSAIEISPTNATAHLKKGMAAFAADEWELALQAFQRGEELEPSNSQFQLWIRKCQAELECEDAMDAEPVKEEPKSQPKAEEPKPEPTPTSAPAPEPKPEPKVRHTWYQNQTHVFITFFAKNLEEKDVSVEFTDDSLEVDIKLPDSTSFVFDAELCDQIVPAECRKNIGKVNMEIKLKKRNAAQWKTLENAGESRLTAWPDISDANKHLYPSSKAKKDWDSILKDEEEDKPEGEAALNKVFKDIYSNGNEDQQRAMLKSFYESNGTVLSTNWGDVGTKKVECTPPKGMEVRQWSKE